MTAIQEAFLKEGWIQVGTEDIPVFFKYEDYNPIYPFHIIFTTDPRAYYFIYNEWVKTNYKLDIEKIIVGAYEHIRTTPKMFTIGINAALSDYYHHQNKTDEMNAYNYIEQYLTSKLKNGV